MGDRVSAALRFAEPPTGGASQQRHGLTGLRAGSLHPGVTAAGVGHAHGAVDALISKGAMQAEGCPCCALSAVVSGDLNNAHQDLQPSKRSAFRPLRNQSARRLRWKRRRKVS